MRNGTDIIAEINGSLEDLQRIQKKIATTVKDRGGVLSGFALNEMNINSVGYDLSTLAISGTGYAHINHKYFQNEIFEKEGVSGFFIDTSKESNYFYLDKYKNGIKSPSVLADYFSKESFLELGETWWIEHEEEHFKSHGSNWKDTCAKELKFFNSCGISTDFLERSYNLTEKKILFIVGNSGTGKTTLATELVNGKHFEPIKSLTSKSLRKESDKQWYEVVPKHEIEEMASDGLLLEFAEYGGELYATTSASILEADGKNLVKAIEPKGLSLIMKKLNDYPNIKTIVVLMDIDKDNVIKNLKEEGFSIDDIVDRINRGDEKSDLKRLSIEPDFIVDRLDKGTTQSVLGFSEEHFKGTDKEHSLRNMVNEYKLETPMQEPKVPTFDLSPTPYSHR